MTIHGSTLCKNCGGEYGIHHYQTDQCPVGGREAPIGQKQEYKTTTFESENDTVEELRADLVEKEKTIASQNEKIKAYQEKFAEILQLAVDEQGDWLGVQLLYAPAWVHSFRAIEDIAREVAGEMGKG